VRLAIDADHAASQGRVNDKKLDFTLNLLTIVQYHNNLVTNEAGVVLLHFFIAWYYLSIFLSPIF
jgi:hypothetical protein